MFLFQSEVVVCPGLVHVCPVVSAAVTFSLLNTVAASALSLDHVTVLMCSFGKFDPPLHTHARAHTHPIPS